MTDEETFMIEMTRSELADMRPRKLLPDDYEENGFAGGEAVEIAGRRIHDFQINEYANDVFVRGGPKGCPYNSKEEVEKNHEPGSDAYMKWVFGSGGSRLEVFWCDYVPEECPFCAEYLGHVKGTLIEYGGVDNFGVVHCPHCDRIYGEY